MNNLELCQNYKIIIVMVHFGYCLPIILPNIFLKSG